MATISINNIARAIYESTRKIDGAELDVVIKDVVNLISRKHMMGKSKEIITQLEKIMDKDEEIVRARVSSRVKIDKKITEEIEDFIKKRYKAKKVVLETITEPKLLGGIKIEIGDEIIDMTLKNKIKKFQNYLITQ